MDGENAEQELLDETFHVARSQEGDPQAIAPEPSLPGPTQVPPPQVPPPHRYHNPYPKTTAPQARLVWVVRTPYIMWLRVCIV